MYYVTIDIGGTTFSFAIFKKKNIITKSIIYPISQYTDPFNFIKNLLEKIDKLLSKENLSLENIKGIGIACPGPLDSKKGKILNTPNLTILKNYDLVKNLKKLTKIENIVIEKDTNVFALGELNLNYPNSKVLIAITLGTGVGFGIAINGKLFTGSNGMGGEYGISPIQNGSNWETLLGKGFFTNISKKIYGSEKTALELSNLYQLGDSHAKSIWNEYGYNLGLCLSHVCNLLNPDTIVFGGGISKAFNFFNSSMIISLKKNCHIYHHNDINMVKREDWTESLYYGGLILLNN